MLFRGLAALASAGAPGTPHSGRKVDQQRDVTATALATPLRQGQGRFRLVKVRWMTAACRLMQALLQDSLGKPEGEVEEVTQLSRRGEWLLLSTSHYQYRELIIAISLLMTPTSCSPSQLPAHWALLLILLLLTYPPRRHPLTSPVYCSTTQHLPSNSPPVLLCLRFDLPIPSLLPTSYFSQ